MKRTLLVLLLLGAGFGYGFVAAKRAWFPHDLLQAAASRLGGEGGAGGGDGRVETRVETGWFEPVEGTAPGENVDLEALDALGYGQTYEGGGDALGVTVHDPRRAWQGLNLVVSAHEPNAALVDMEGETLHEWRLPYEDVPLPAGYDPDGIFGTRYWRRARLLEDGELLAIYDRTALVKLDARSRPLWALAGGYHHDLDVTADGTIWVLEHDVRVIPRIHPTRETFEDFVTRVSPDGRVLGRVSLLEAFERSPYSAYLEDLSPDESARDIFHTNTLEVFEGDLGHVSPLFGRGKALVSIWGLDAVAVVDLEREEVVWALSGLWHRQHEPVVLGNGHLLVFDNMGHHGMSKVIELDPFTQEVAWAYEGTEENGFYSALIGSCQRLPNGNTLITESLAGRAFEVTPDEEIVWEYHSPHRVETSAGEGVAVLMDVVRLDPDLPLGWLE